MEWYHVYSENGHQSLLGGLNCKSHVLRSIPPVTEAQCRFHFPDKELGDRSSKRTRVHHYPR
jgi:hypothetical protein